MKSSNPPARDCSHSRPSRSDKSSVGSRRESTELARHSIQRRCFFLATNLNHAVERASTFPKHVELIASSVALPGAALVAGTIRCGKFPTTNLRGLESPNRPTNRASYVLGGTLEAIAILNLL